MYNESTMKMIVGLGNPGEQYRHTRHNIGRELVSAYAEKNFFADWSKSSKAEALYAEGEIGNVRTLLVLPETFMNVSGKSVQYLMKQHNLTAQDVVIVYDDLDVPVGEFKISHDRGSGGHNGVQSVIDMIGSREFVRVRVGVAPRTLFGNVKRPTGDAIASFVLKRFAQKELRAIDLIEQDIFDAFSCIVTEDADRAMNRFN